MIYFQCLLVQGIFCNSAEKILFQVCEKQQHFMGNVEHGYILTGKNYY